VLRQADWLESIHGTRQPVRVERFVATDKLTMGKIDLPPGIVTDPAASPGDIVGVVTDGWAGITWAGRPEWLEMQRWDGCLIPAGTSYRLLNVSDQPATFVFGAAPGVG
jgi:quercetin dioxygenase-like cupin family protein